MLAQKRVTIYARVSTLDRGQDPETQLVALRAYAEHRGFVTVGEYVEYASSIQEDRPQYRALLAAAKKRQIDVLLVWRYDRFARSTQALVNALKEFQSLGLDFISYQEHIDTTTPQGPGRAHLHGDGLHRWCTRPLRIKIPDPSRAV